MKESVLVLREGADSIFGKLYSPASYSGRHPILVYCHGLAQSGEEGKRICADAVNEGWLAYSFDFRGGSPTTRSGGDYFNMSPQTEIEDLEWVLRQLRKRDDVDSKRIYLCGHSLGGMVAAITGCRQGDSIAGMVLLAPALNMPETFSKKYPFGRNVPDTLDLSSLHIGGKFARDAAWIDPYLGMTSYDGDVLIIQGDKDEMVPMESARQAALLFRNATLKVLDGVGHVFKGEAGKRMHALLQEYIRAHSENAR